MKIQHISLRKTLSLADGPLSPENMERYLSSGWTLQPLSVRFVGLDAADPNIGHFEQLNSSTRAAAGKTDTNIYKGEDTWAKFMPNVIPNLPVLADTAGSYMHLMCWVKGQVRYPFCVIETHKGPANPGDWSIRNLRIHSTKVGDTYKPDAEGYITACKMRNSKWLAENNIFNEAPPAPEMPKEIKVTWHPAKVDATSFYPEHWTFLYPVHTSEGVRMKQVYVRDDPEEIKYATAAATKALQSL